MNIDISMDVHVKSVEMDMDVKFHIHDNPAQQLIVPASRGDTRYFSYMGPKSEVKRMKLGPKTSPVVGCT